MLISKKLNFQTTLMYMPPLYEAATTLLVIICLTVYIAPIYAADGNSDVCRLFANNTLIGDPESCNRYIKCIDFVSHYFDCTGTTPVYDKDTAKCAKTLNNTSSCTFTCEDSVDKFVADPKSCDGYFYCFDEEFAISGVCPAGTHFNATDQMCIHSFTSDCGIQSFDACSNLKDGTNMKDEQNCHMYYTCAKGKLTSKSCTSKYYNAATGACVSKALVECPAHPLPKNVCGTAKTPLRNAFVSDDATCRGYFYCRSLPDGPDENPSWGQCGKDKFFDASKQLCVDPLDVKCTEDRCDGRTLTFVCSGTKGCRNYLRCGDDITLAELSCGNSFFDEKLGACVNSVVSYAACKG